VAARREVHGARAKQLRKDRSLDEAHHEILDVARGADGVNRDDVGVVDGGDGEGFALEAVDEFAVGVEARREHLDGDLAPQLGVVALVHRAHAAAADGRVDAKLPVENRAGGDVLVGVGGLDERRAAACAKLGVAGGARAAIGATHLAAGRVVLNPDVPSHSSNVQPEV
jgi:hypothetical protein